MNDNNTLKKAITLSAIGKYSTVILQLVATGILSRILTPNEYGTIAIILVFVVFFQLFADMGFGSAIIQDKNLTEEEVNHIYSITFYLGLLLMVSFIILAYPISLIYNDFIYINIGILLSFSLLFSAFNIVPNAITLKKKMFLKVALRTIVVSLISFVVAILSAFNGFGVYALVFQSIANSIGIFLWNRFNVPLKIYFKPDFKVLKKIWVYSMFQFGSQAVNYLNRNLDNLLIGKFFNKSELGQYNKAYTLMQYPISFLPGIITPVLHPILSEYQNNRDFIYTKYLSMLKVLSLLGIFGSVFSFFAGEEIILIVFGNQWYFSITPFKFLSLSLWMQIMTNTVGAIYQSLGQTKLMFFSTVITTIIISGLIIIGVLLNSIDYVALLVSVGYIISFFITFYLLVKNGFSKKFNSFLGNFIKDFLIFTLMILLALFWPLSINNIYISILAKFSVMSLSYLLLLILTGQYKIFIAFLKHS